MAKQQSEKSRVVRVRKAVRRAASPSTVPGSALRATTAGACEDCRATTAFQAWHSVDMTSSANWGISFADWKIVPKGKRAVIELVTARITVPSGKWARLRMYTSLGTVASNLDLFLTFQGDASGQAIYVATHSIRAYTDNEINFEIEIERDNATTRGSGLICVSGYVAN
jgi:hypothetical protein